MQGADLGGGQGGARATAYFGGPQEFPGGPGGMRGSGGDAHIVNQLNAMS